MISNQFLQSLTKSFVPDQTRFFLKKGEYIVLQLPEQYRGIRVISGLAWVSLENEAAALTTGEEYWFASSINDAWVSAEGATSLTFEILQVRVEE